MIGSLFTLAAVMKFAHAAFMGTPTAHALAAKEAPVAMLIPMGALAAASVVFGLFPGLLLVPIAAIESELGFAPITASLLGPLPGLEGWSPLLLTALTAMFAILLLPWLRMGRGAEVVRSNVHLCGVVDVAAGGHAAEHGQTLRDAGRGSAPRPVRAGARGQARGGMRGR